MDIAAEAARAVQAAVGVPRRKVKVPQRVVISQLAGCHPLDQSLVPALPLDRPLRVLEIFAGVGSATQALARLGYSLGEVVACEARGAARVVHAHSLTELAREFPQAVSSKAGAQLHHRFPQDIRLVTRQSLCELGPIDLVVAGWPCQGSSAAGNGQGLDDHRSGLFTELMRVLTELQEEHRGWGRQMAYLIEHVAAGHDKRPRVREHFEAVRGLLGPELVLDAAQLGSRAHRLRAWWTNLEGVPLLSRAALERQERPPGLFVHQILGSGRRAKVPKTAGVAPWAKVEVPGTPRRALNTFVSYGGSYAFSRGGGGVLSCTQKDGRVTFEEPTAEERALAMGFPREFAAAPGVSELTRRELLGQAMDLNSLMWILAACQEGGRRRRTALGGDRSGASAGNAVQQVVQSGGQVAQVVAAAAAQRAEAGGALTAEGPSRRRGQLSAGVQQQMARAQ